MTDPQRLLEGGDEIEAALLRSAKPDAPSGAATRRTLAALGLAGGAVVAAGLAAASAAPPASTAVAAAKGGSFVLVKWVGVATLAGLGVWGAAHQMNESDPAELHTAVGPTARALTVAASTAMERHEKRAFPVLAFPGLALSSSDAKAPDSQRPKPAQAADGDLAAEVTALDDARRAMAKDPEAALAAIQAYDAKFKNKGALGHEAEVLRIEALARAGESDRARALGEAFLARNPASPLAPRVRSVLAR